MDDDYSSEFTEFAEHPPHKTASPWIDVIEPIKVNFFVCFCENFEKVVLSRIEFVPAPACQHTPGTMDRMMDDEKMWTIDRVVQK